MDELMSKVKAQIEKLLTNVKDIEAAKMIESLAHSLRILNDVKKSK